MGHNGVKSLAERLDISIHDDLNNGGERIEEPNNVCNVLFKVDDELDARDEDRLDFFLQHETTTLQISNPFLLLEEKLRGFDIVGLRVGQNLLSDRQASLSRVEHGLCL
ncbi:unnamed protein product [Clonostachys rosea]|uniref:Uncharacterized protein n=1 Tax=Bionectria ochroleuca TaxID=29856 RepID=A0ABY6UAM6_BIOOC|nr:unnamed protein product [Clonostachys rosea]